MTRIIFCACVALALSACASIPNPIVADVRGGVFVDDVSVAWSVDDASRTDNETYVTGRTDLVARLQAAVEAQFASSPSGPDAVSFSIDVKRYSRVGAAMGNIIGGSNRVTADVTVVRTSDGVTLGVYEGVFGIYASNHGLLGAIAQAAAQPDIVGIMSNNFAVNLNQRFNSK